MCHTRVPSMTRIGVESRSSHGRVLDELQSLHRWPVPSMSFTLELHTRQLPMGASHCQLGGLTNRNICNIYAKIMSVGPTAAAGESMTHPMTDRRKARKYIRISFVPVTYQTMLCFPSEIAWQIRETVTIYPTESHRHHFITGGKGLSKTRYKNI